MNYIFVGHAFSKEQIDDLRSALIVGIPMLGGELWFSDEHPSTGLLFDKIKDGIDNAFACIYEISDNTKANVFLELGYAMGRDKDCIMICRKGTIIPTDLKGFEFLEYESYKDLSQQLKNKFIKIIEGKIATPLSKVVIIALANQTPTKPRKIANLQKEVTDKGELTDDMWVTLNYFDKNGIIKISGDFIEIKNAEKLSQLASLSKQ